MASLNKVFLLGRCTQKPELRSTPRGTPVAEVGIAINRTWVDENGQRQHEAAFFDITIWGKLAQVAEHYLDKGTLFMIEGRLSLDTWDDKQTGQKRSKLRITAETLQLLTPRNAATSPGQKESLPAPSSTEGFSGPQLGIEGAAPSSIPVKETGSSARPLPPPRGVPEPDLEF